MVLIGIVIVGLCHFLWTRFYHFNRCSNTIVCEVERKNVQQLVSATLIIKAMLYFCNDFMFTVNVQDNVVNWKCRSK